MDEKVKAVLDAYHERMREEDAEMQRMAPGTRRELRDRRLLAVGPEAAQFLNILARGLKTPQILEIGTSYGYSTIWLAEAARTSGGRLTTIEIQDYKSIYASEMAARAGLGDFVDFKVGDALAIIPELPFQFDFVLVDHWKNLYAPALEVFYPKLRAGAIVVADNMIGPNSEETLRYAREIRAKPKMASVLLPVGHGLEISRYGD